MLLSGIMKESWPLLWNNAKLIIKAENELLSVKAVSIGENR